MWRQIASGLLGVVLSAAPVSGLERVAAPQVEPLRYPSHVLSGTEAIRVALKEVTQELINRYYQKYGGLFVTRRVVERTVTRQMNKKREALLKMLQRKYMCNGRTVRFNPRTAQVSYFEGRGLKTVTIREIAATIMDSQKKNSSTS